MTVDTKRGPQVIMWRLLAVAGILLSVGWNGAADVGFDGIDYPMPFSLADVEIHESGHYDIVGYVGADPDWAHDRIGYPQLPVLAIRFLLPRETRLEDVRVTVLEADTLRGTYLPIPIQPEDGEQFVPPDPRIYESWDAYPANPVRVTADGHLRTFHLATLLVYPLQYVGASQKLLLLESVRIEGNLRQMNESELAQVHKRYRQDPRPIEQRSDIQWILQMVRNPWDFEVFYPRYDDNGLEQFSSTREERPFGGFRPTEFPSLEGPPVACVIITDSVDVAGASIGTDMITEFQRLADWKTKKGVPSIIRTVGWIDENYSGADRPEKIRAFVRDASTCWGTDFVLLGGDVDVVPARLLGGPESRTEADLDRADPPADIYYAELDKSWNANENAFYGESLEDFPAPISHEYCDLWIGRVPARDGQEVGTIVDKILTYERSPDAPAGPSPDTAYYDDVLLVAGPTDEADATNDNCVVFAETVLADMLESCSPEPDLMRLYCHPPDHREPCGGGGPLTRCYEDFYDFFQTTPCAPPGDPTCDHFTAENFRTELESGSHFVFHMEHSWRDKLGDITPLEDKWTGCDTTSWRNECLDSLRAANPGWQGDLHWDVVDHLTNAPEYSIVVSGGSYTNQWDLDAIGEHFLRTPSGGAVGYFGKTASYGTYQLEPAEEFFANVFTREVVHLGEATGQATNATAYAPLRAGITWDLLGDPEMPLWTKAPGTLSLFQDSGPIYQLGAQACTLTVTDATTSLPVEGARICLKDRDLSYAVAWTDGGGEAVFPSFQVLSTDSISVVAWTRDYEPYVGWLRFGSIATPHCIIYDWHWRDDLVSGGDGDDVLEAGETVELRVVAKDIGSNLGSTSGVIGRLWPTAPFVCDLDIGGSYLPTSIYVGGLGAHPPALGDTFRLPANWEAIRPEGAPSPPAGENTFALWRDNDALWHLKGAFADPGEQETLAATLVTQGGFSDVDDVDLEQDDELVFDPNAPDTISVTFEPDDDPDEVQFRAEADKWLTATADSIWLGNMAAGDTASGVFTVAWTEEVPDQDEMVFTLAVHDASDEWWYSDFSETVHAPQVRLMVQHVETSTKGDDDVVEIWPVLCNTGGATADSCYVTFVPEVPPTFDQYDFFAGFGAVAPGDMTVAGDSLYLRDAEDDWVENLQYGLLIHTVHPNEEWSTETLAGLDIEPPSAVPEDLWLDEDGGTVFIRWEGVDDEDLAGYHVFQETYEGIARLTREPVVGVTRYEVSGLAALDDDGDYINYFFSIAAVDSSGNESFPAQDIVSRVCLPELTGWPRSLPTGSECAPKVYDVDPDPAREIFTAGKDIYAWHHDGTSLIPAHSDGLFYDTGSNVEDHHAMFVEALAIADIDADGHIEVVGNLAPDSIIVVEYNATQGAATRQWARKVASSRAAPIIADLDDDGYSEIILPGDDEWIYVWNCNGQTFRHTSETTGRFCHNPDDITWNLRSLAVGEISTQHDGLEIVQSVRGPGDEGEANPLPQVMCFATDQYDLDAQPIWARAIGNDPDVQWLSTPVIGDVNDDGADDIVVCGETVESYQNDQLTIDALGGIWILDTAGAVQDSVVSEEFRFIGGSQPPAAPALGQGRRGVSREIVAGGGIYGHKSDPDHPWADTLRAHLWFAQYTDTAAVAIDRLPIPGRRLFEMHTSSQPVIADIEQNGCAALYDVFVCTNTGWMAAYEYHPWNPIYPDYAVFRPKLGWPRRFGDMPLTPTIADVDRTDDYGRELVVQDRSGVIHVLDVPLEGLGVGPVGPWTQYGHDPCNTFNISTEVEGRGGAQEYYWEPGLETTFLRIGPNPLSPLMHIRLSLESPIRVRLELFDLQGRRVRLLADKPFSAGRHDLAWDGREDGGEEVAGGVYFLRVSGGGRQEVRKITVVR